MIFGCMQVLTSHANLRTCPLSRTSAPSHVQELPPGAARLGGCPVSIGRGGVGAGWATVHLAVGNQRPCYFTMPAPDPQGDCYTLRGPVYTLT